MENIKWMATIVKNNIQDSLKLTELPGEVYFTDNRCLSIQVDNHLYDEHHTFMHIRLLPNRDQTKLNISISTVEVDIDKRNQGIFTILCKRLKHCKYTDKLFITGVCTNEMRNFCRRYKFKCINEIEDGFGDYIVNNNVGVK